MHLRTAAVLALALAAPAAADVVTTTDGVVLEGSVVREADGTVVVRTPEGTVRLPGTAVRSVEAGVGPRTALRAALAALPPGDAAGRFRIALQAEAAGLSEVAREAYLAVVATDVDHPAARRALGHEKVDGAWVPAEEALRRRGLVLYAGQWLLPVEAETAARAAALPPARDVSVVATMRAAATGDLALARAAEVALAKAPPEARTAAALAALRDPQPKVRTWACSHLAALGDESALRPLMLSAVRDADAGVRTAAARAVGAFGHDDAAVPFVRALGSEHPGLVASAAAALGALGDPRAVHYLVRRISHGGSPRAFVQFGTMVSYVRDYDVEVAQSSNIADPVIGIVQEGIVLDAKILDVAIESTTVQTALIGAFNALVGARAKDADDVLAWYSAKGASIPDFPAKPQPRRKSPTTPASR